MNAKRYKVQKVSQRLGWGITDSETGRHIDDFADKDGHEYAAFSHDPRPLMKLAANLNANPEMRHARTAFQKRFYSDVTMFGMVNEVAR